MRMYGIIYKITNNINGKVYIGQTIHSFQERYDGHIKNTRNAHLRRAISRYGEDAFVVDETLDAAETKEELDRKEQYYIALYKSNQKRYGYNLMSGGHNGQHAEESKRKIAEAQMGEKNHMFGKYGENNPLYSRVALICDYCGKLIEVAQSSIKRSKHHYCSDECRKASKAHVKYGHRSMIVVECSNCGKPFETYPSKLKKSQYLYCSKKCQNEHYKKLFAGDKNPNFGNHKVVGGNNGRAKKVYCITTNETFSCAIEAGQKYGIKRGLIPACCRGEQKTAGGKEWKYCD